MVEAPLMATLRTIQDRPNVYGMDLLFHAHYNHIAASIISRYNMSLVAYDSSDDSGDENGNDSELETKDDSEPNGDDHSTTNHAIGHAATMGESSFQEKKIISASQKNKQKGVSSLFSSLPAPKSEALKFEVESKLTESADDDVPRKQPVKITVPSLSEFKDEEDEEPVTKKLKPSSKGSGLFSILPAPKNMSVKEVNRPLVPHSVKKKAVPSTKNVPETPKKLSTDLFNYADSEEESGDEDTSSSKDFFALTEETTSVSSVTTDVTCTNNSITSESQESSGQFQILDALHLYSSNPQSEEPLTSQLDYQQNFWLQYGTVPPPPPPPPPPETPPPETPPPETPSPEMEVQEVTGTADHIPVDNGELQLDEEALQRLCGRRAKRQGQAMELIDVSGDALMPDPKEWLMKQLTQEQQTKVHGHSHRRNDGPTTQQRRKHQITYLAFQAKENELELKNQWSQNRMSKKQTQSKYGF